MLRLSERWAPILDAQPETGMGYQIATIVLRNGQKFRQALIDSGYVIKIRGISGIPFEDSDIAEILVTHEKWDFSHEEKF
jgi:hypothetical protein